MSTSNLLSLNLESILERYKKVDQRKYQQQSITELTNGLNVGKDVGVELPTGTGKTIIFTPVAAEAAETGFRTLILSATKQGQRRVEGEYEKFANNSKPSLVFGKSEYYCPLLNGAAQAWCCKDNKKSYCIPMDLGCDVIKIDDEYDKNKIIITNFSKFLQSSYKNKFGLIVLDDSHGFENAKEQAFQLAIQFAPIRELYEKGIADANLSEFIENFLNLFGEVFGRCVPPDEKEGVVSQDYVKYFSDDLLKDETEDKVKDAIKNIDGKPKQLCWDLYYFVQRARKSSNFQFYIRKDFYEPDDYDSSELISRMDEKTVNNIINSKFENARVVFATATPGDITNHAHACTNRNYEVLGLETTPTEASSTEIDNWFSRLKILVVNDIEDTRSSDGFNQVMELSIKILKTFKKRSLLLFKNYRDQKKACDKLSNIFDPSKLFFIDSTFQSSDKIEDYANKKEISLASASSTLWEGITINDLQIAIIASVPFIRPSIGMRKSYPLSERRMLVRLQQGIGRIIRSPTDCGIAVLAESRFNKYLSRAAFSNRLKPQIQTVKSDNIIDEMASLFSKWEAK